METKIFTLMAAPNMGFKSKLPSNIWGLLVGSILSWNEQHTSQIMLMLPVYLGAILSVVVQSFFVYQISSIAAAGEDASCSALEEISEIGLLWQCIFVYVGNIIYNDIDETVSIFAYQHQFNLYRRDDVWQGGLHFRSDGAVTGKICCAARVLIIFLLCAKTALSVCLMHYGVGFLSQSSSKEEVLLNAVAVLFISDVDELVYNLATSSRHKQIMENMPSVLILQTNPDSPDSNMESLLLLGTFTKMGTTIFVVSVLQWLWCDSGLSNTTMPWVSLALMLAGVLAGGLASGMYLVVALCIGSGDAFISTS